MRFWIRHVILLVLCLVLPAAAALYFDAEGEGEQARISGAAAGRLASQALKQRLTLEAHRGVSQAIGLAQTLRDQEALKNVARGRAEAFTATREALAAEAPPGGFAWLVDDAGQILVAHDMTEPPETPRDVSGHPIFRQTQVGYALDGFWTFRGPVVMVAGAPIDIGGSAAGAVLIGREINSELASTMARDIEAQVTLVAADEVAVTTLDDALAQDVVAATKDAVEPVLAGRLEEPLGGASLPLLPLFIDPHAEGLAYSSVNVSVPGAPPGALHWVVTVKSSQSLEAVAQRQEVSLGVVFAALLLALLIGLLNFRTFVTPIERVSAHLSEIQLGRGDLELPESRVSKPFRRLVRLINMTVQKMPQRSMSSLGSAADLPFMADPAPRAQSGLQLSRPDQVPEPPQIPMPAPVLPQEAEIPPPAPPPPAPPPPSPDPIADIPMEPPTPMVPEDVVPEAPAPVAPPPAPVEEEGDDDAIAAAIAALEQGTGPVPSTDEEPPQAPSRSASEIRGRRVDSEVGSPFDVAEGSAFGRTNSQVGAESTSPGVRGGGSLDLSGHAGIEQGEGHAEIGDGEFGDGDFNPEATVVAPVQEDLLAKSARDDLTDAIPAIGSAEDRPDHTVVASVPPDLLAQSAREGTNEVRALSRGGSRVVRDETLDASDRAHFKEVYERFIEMRKRCGENTGDLAFDRFLSKLTRNRDNLIKKYSCRTVRFQVYEKDGKAALKATPVRAR